MAKKRKSKAKNHRRRTANPSAPSFPIGRMVPVRGVKVNKHGVVEQVIVEDKHLRKLKRAKRKK